jgi:hypothetical protein
MSAVSQAQQSAMAIALHRPSKLHKSNKGLLKMSHKQLCEFATTSRKGLPRRTSVGDMMNPDDRED